MTLSPVKKNSDNCHKCEGVCCNEIHIGNGGGTINTEIKIPHVYVNMETFNGFQFDVLY
jgi:hypothetical protein